MHLHMHSALECKTQRVEKSRVLFPCVDHTSSWNFISVYYYRICVLVLHQSIWLQPLYVRISLVATLNYQTNVRHKLMSRIWFVIQVFYMLIQMFIYRKTEENVKATHCIKATHHMITCSWFAAYASLVWCEVFCHSDIDHRPELWNRAGALSNVHVILHHIPADA